MFKRHGVLNQLFYFIKGNKLTGVKYIRNGAYNWNSRTSTDIK